MGAHCSKVATVVSDSCKEEDVAKKIVLLLDPKKQGGRHSEVWEHGHTQCTASPCIATHGGKKQGGRNSEVWAQGHRHTVHCLTV